MSHCCVGGEIQVDFRKRSTTVPESPIRTSSLRTPSPFRLMTAERLKIKQSVFAVTYIFQGGIDLKKDFPNVLIMQLLLTP